MKSKGNWKEYEKDEKVHSIFGILELARDKLRKIELYKVTFSRNSKLLELTTLRGVTCKIFCAALK